MNLNLEERLENFRIILLNYLFDEDNDNIKKWNNNEEIKITKKFYPLLQGDWSRLNKWNKSIPIDRLNLDKIKNTYITKKELYKLLFDNFPVKVKSNYRFNFNPNLFFLFYDDFYETYKYGEFKDESDITRGIKFKIEIEKQLRIEFCKIIELHSRIILNPSIKKHIATNYEKYFIENCYIQYEIDELNKYIDLCYIIEDKKLLLEINEFSHNELDDKVRSISVLLSSRSRLIHYDIAKYYHTNDYIYENIIIHLCKILYHNNLQAIALKIYLIEIKKMDPSQIDVGVSIRRSEYKLKLSELFTLPFFEKILDVDKIIKNVCKKGNIIIQEDFSICPTDENYKTLIREKNILELTSHGIINFLTSIDGKYWSRRKDYIKFMNDLENKFYNAMESLLENDDYELLNNELIKYKKILKFIDYDQSIFHKKAKTHYFDVHKTVPFIIKSKNNKDVVEYDLLSKIINEQIKQTINIDEFGENKYIIGYRYINDIELKNIYKIDDSRFID